MFTHTFFVFFLVLFAFPFPAVDKLTKCPMCQKTFDDPRTLLCLHSFCLGCLEAQEFTAKSKSSDLRCHQCSAPFTLPGLSGVALFSCNTFIDSLVKSAKANQGDINRVVKCGACDEEDATEHCVDCEENLGPACANAHRRMKVSAMHHQIPLEEALAGNPAVKRIPRCQKHISYEVDSYCKTCTEAVCAKCAVEKHPKHDFCPLSQVTGPLQDQIAGYTIAMSKREEDARRAIDTLDGTINKIEDHRSTAERDIATFSSTLYAAVDARVAVLVSEMQTKGDQLRKTAIQEKGEAESATVQFREFHSFTEGMLAQGTPLEIAGTHRMVRASHFCLCEVVWLIFQLFCD